jgi:hypothetical protein
VTYRRESAPFHARRIERESLSIALDRPAHAGEFADKFH